MEILDRITAFAAEAHGPQTRKYTTDPYIVHPVRVMEICREYTDDLPVLAAALLHDVLEDTPVGEAEIERFLQTVMTAAQVRKTITLVRELTDVYTRAGYPEWNRRRRKEMELKRILRTSAEAQTIKYADILDNSREILQYDRDFGKRFLGECRAILKVAGRGNKQLRQRASDVVEDGLATFR